MCARVTRRSRRREMGATAVEYALMVLLIAIVVITAVIVLGESLSTFFNDAAQQV